MKMYNLEVGQTTDGDIFIKQEVTSENKETVFLTEDQIEPVAEELLRISSALANTHKA